jgi:hypothetical protein
MGLRRLAIGALVVVATLAAAAPVAGKEGVKATLATKIPLEAKPGTRLEVAWTLASVDEDGLPRPFGASGVFVRLLSASGADAKTGFADQDTGAYTATVVVPQGGIGDVEVGIRGETDSGPSDLLFPITNDPVRGTPHAASLASDQPASERSGGGPRAWVFAIVGSSLFAIGIAAVAFAGRKQTAGG